MLHWIISCQIKVESSIKMTDIPFPPFFAPYAFLGVLKLALLLKFKTIFTVLFNFHAILASIFDQFPEPQN